jgi:carbon storage regulator CsrA
MLVLSRRLNEKLILPEVEAAIQVVAIQPAAVRLGIEAPARVSVVREEIYRTMRPVAEAQTEREDAARTLDRLQAHLAVLERQLGPNPGPALRETLARLNGALDAVRGALEARPGTARVRRVSVCR